MNKYSHVAPVSEAEGGDQNQEHRGRRGDAQPCGNGQGAHRPELHPRRQVGQQQQRRRRSVAEQQ